MQRAFFADLPMLAQTPRDITGDFDGRDQLIPAVYGAASLADPIPALPNEDPLNAILGARSALAQQTPALARLCTVLTISSGHQWLLTSDAGGARGKAGCQAM